MKLKDFTYLMLACLANNSVYMHAKNGNNLTAYLPITYKQIIEEILCSENGWKEAFSVLINIEEYFKNHFIWEQELSCTLNEVLNELGKTIEYHHYSDSLIIHFTKEEVEEILNRYTKENLQLIMTHFTNLLTDYIFTREYVEHFNCTRSYVNAVEKMHEIYKKQLEEDLPKLYRTRSRRRKTKNC